MFNALIDLTVLASPSRTRGIGRYAADLGRALAARARSRADIAVHGIEALPLAGAADISPDAASAVAHLAAGSGAFTHPAWAWRVRLRLAAAARQAGADLVHSPHPDASPIGRLRCPRVVTCHDLINVAYGEQYATWRDGWAPGRRWLDARRYHRADHVIAVSRATADDLVRLLAIPARRISVVRNGADLTRVSAHPAPGDEAACAALGLADRPFLLYVGGADWRKNAAGMFDIVAALRRRAANASPALAWAGRIDERDAPAVRHLAAARGIQGDVRLLGWVPDTTLAALLRRAAALLFVSRAEGFGYPIVEAMASGCPVVCGRQPAAVEVGGDAACFVDLDRADAIADAIVLLLDDGAERRLHVERGLARCRLFEASRMADETLDVYRRVIGGVS